MVKPQAFCSHDKMVAGMRNSATRAGPRAEENALPTRLLQGDQCGVPEIGGASVLASRSRLSRNTGCQVKGQGLATVLASESSALRNSGKIRRNPTQSNRFKTLLCSSRTPTGIFRNPNSAIIAEELVRPGWGLEGWLAQPTAGAVGYYLPLLRSFTGRVVEPAALRKNLRNPADSNQIKPLLCALIVGVYLYWVGRRCAPP